MIKKRIIDAFQKIGLFAFVFYILTGTILVENLTSYSAQRYVQLYLFYSETCPHCKSEISFLEELKTTRDDININYFELSKSKENLELFFEVQDKLNSPSAGVPYLVVGNEVLVGYRDADSTGVQIINIINKTLEEDRADLIYDTVFQNDNTDLTEPEEVNEEEPLNDPGTDKEVPSSENENIEYPQDDSVNKDYLYLVNIPILGQVNLKGLSLPFLSVILGTLDGFNPCAMWVLLFLITILLKLKDRRRMWILGITFILSSGLVYFLFLSAWLNFFLIIGLNNISRIVIGILAIIIGIYFLYDFYLDKTGCKIVNEKQRNNIFKRILDTTSNHSLIISIFGMIFIAFMVNTVELMCSLGLPAVYTNILSMSSLHVIQYYLLMLLYLLFFMIDDIVIFFIAMMTFKVLGIQEKYSKMSHLIGGIIILILGILLLTKPELLIFT